VAEKCHNREIQDDAFFVCFYRLKEFGAWYGNLDGIIMSIAEKPGCTPSLNQKGCRETGS